MTVRFPVTASVRATGGDFPPGDGPEVYIHDAFGYRVSLGGLWFDLPGDQLDLGTTIATMLNRAYEQGRCDQAEAIRELLDYGKDI